MKTMFKIGSIALMLLSFGAAAQSGNGLSYRDGDPFLFCTKGQDPVKEPLPCWTPVDHIRTYMRMPYCQPEDPYGKPWTTDDYKSLQEYLTICPQAERSGDWEGPGIPETSPSRWH
ncbi:hypothetical protein [Stenotrophomonas sp.]|uniref:hypothetical protein n=1 Tax=Stenotrophomonas sp. TaxID=69392 RepID=UPI0028AC01CE|nr:hypothetical protein [Stenotrophomonas sp.]